MKFVLGTDWLGLDEKWAKDDVQFFRSGACHILATAFLEKYTTSEFRAEVIYPKKPFQGSHVFVSNGILAFDSQGYRTRKELITSHEKIFLGKNESWSYELIKIEQQPNSLTSQFWEQYKFNNFHIWGSQRDPKKRAHEFLAKLSSPESYMLNSNITL